MAENLMIKRDRRKTWSSGAMVVASLLCCIGCGGSGIDLGTVEGRVTKGGQPAANYWVRFTPSAGGRPGNGRTDADGRYELVYTFRDKGARVGPNRVEVGTGGEVDDRGNEISPPVEVLEIEKVVEGGDNVIDLEIPG
jgi:hypothetical protein